MNDVPGIDINELTESDIVIRDYHRALRAARIELGKELAKALPLREVIRLAQAIEAGRDYTPPPTVWERLKAEAHGLRVRVGAWFRRARRRAHRAHPYR